MGILFGQGSRGRHSESSRMMKGQWMEIWKQCQGDISIAGEQEDCIVAGRSDDSMTAGSGGMMSQAVVVDMKPPEST